MEEQLEFKDDDLVAEITRLIGGIVHHLGGRLVVPMDALATAEGQIKVVYDDETDSVIFRLESDDSVI